MTVKSRSSGLDAQIDNTSAILSCHAGRSVIDFHAMESMLLAASALGRLGQSVWYALIAISAAVFLLVSLVFGHDHDADHDVDHDHGVDHEGSAGMSFFSTKVLLMFGTGFGAGGYFATRLGMGAVGCAAAGVGTGLAMAAAGYAFLNAL